MELIERYTKTARWFHWLIAVVFLELVVSGLLIFVPWINSDMIGIWTRITHRIGAVVLIGAPVLFAIFAWRRTWDFIKEGRYNYVFSHGWDVLIPGIKEERYEIKPLMRGQLNIAYYELMAEVLNAEGELVGYCFVELLSGARNKIRLYQQIMQLLRKS